MLECLGMFGAGNIGIDAAGMHQMHADRAVQQLNHQCLGKTAHGEFAGTVVGIVRRTDKAEDAGDVDDCSFIVLKQLRQKRLSAVDHTKEIDIHDALVAGCIRCPHRLAGTFDAGVVDHHMGGAKMGFDLVGKVVHGCAVRHIERRAIQLGR